jgi:hypothetical protein
MRLAATLALLAMLCPWRSNAAPAPAPDPTRAVLAANAYPITLRNGESSAMRQRSSNSVKPTMP